MVLERLFAECFTQGFATRLVGGAEEPLYLPAEAEGQLHCIFYRQDFFASALHEVAHWCIAGAVRRTQVDYGYWYAADGRNRDQQHDFDRVEVKPQAIEWHFALAACHPFRISNEKLSQQASSSGQFAASVAQQAGHYCQSGLPERAEQFRQRLAGHFGGVLRPAPALFETVAQ